MSRFYACILLLLVFLPSQTLLSQSPRLLDHSKLKPLSEARMVEGQPLPAAAPQAPRPQPAVQARTTAVSPVAMGTASNLFSALYAYNQNVVADDSTGLLLFIHRNNTTVFGGTNGDLRYDISTDNGLSWQNNIGLLNVSPSAFRSPQIAAYDAPGNANPLSGTAITYADHLTPPTWTGAFFGTSTLQTTGSPTVNEQLFPIANMSSGGGITEGMKGEYWIARIKMSSSLYLDTLAIYKGTYNAGTQTIAWAQHQVLHMPFNRSFNGNAKTLPASVAFSPDGSTGWIATLGDLAGGNDSVMLPILMKSTNGGATWGAPQEIDLNSFGWVYDSLRALWTDSLNQPYSNGSATAAFEYDLSVDAAGNPHMFFVIGSSESAGILPQYSLFSALSKYAVDLTSSNQGASFDLQLVAPILTFRGTYGSGNGHTQDNYPQVATTQDGQYVFYTWVDSDTSLYTGSMLGIGFGESDNLSPNLWIAGRRLSDGWRTCIHDVSLGDPVWNGKILTPQMAPRVIRSGSGGSSLYKLPVVVGEMPGNDPALPCAYHYFGNDAILLESDFSYPPGSTVFWGGCQVNTAVAGNIQGKVYLDQNSNGVFDGGDSGIPNRTVTTTGLTYADLSDASGDFDIDAFAPYTYGLVTAPFNPAVWTTTVPAAPYNLSLSVPGTTLTGNDFGLAPASPNAQDLRLYLATGTSRQFAHADVTAYVQNIGTQNSSGTLTLTYDSLTTYYSATPAPLSHDPLLRQVTWAVTAVPPFGIQSYLLRTFVPVTTPIGTNLRFDGSIALTGTDLDPGNNTDLCYSEVVGPYDPNDKNSTPPGTGPNNSVPLGQDLRYRIRFQNVGNASAINVVVRDTLSTDLDIATLQMLGASHAYNLSIREGHILVWEFLGINLPDSNSNEPGSHGHIDFYIAPKANTPTGTVVENKASIYFDFNAPVVTAPTWVTYDLPAGGTPTPAQAPLMRIYPHPVSGQSRVEFQRYQGQAWTFELIDIQGRVIFQQNVRGQAHLDLHRDGLRPGLYLYRVSAKGMAPKVGRVVFE